MSLLLLLLRDLIMQKIVHLAKAQNVAETNLSEINVWGPKGKLAGLSSEVKRSSEEK
jgi:hypothetical protein